MAHISNSVPSFKAGEDLEMGYAVILSAENTVTLPASADNEDVIGITEHRADSGKGIGIRIDGECFVIAGGTYAVGDLIIADVYGKSIKLPSTAGEYFVIGKALKAGTAGEASEILIRFQKVTVS